MGEASPSRIKPRLTNKKNGTSRAPSPTNITLAMRGFHRRKPSRPCRYSPDGDRYVSYAHSIYLPLANSICATREIFSPAIGGFHRRSLPHHANGVYIIKAKALYIIHAERGISSAPSAVYHHSPCECISSAQVPHDLMHIKKTRLSRAWELLGLSRVEFSGVISYSDRRNCRRP